MYSKAADICLRFLKSFGTKVDIAEPVFSLDYNKDLSDGRFAQRETAIFVRCQRETGSPTSPNRQNCPNPPKPPI